MNVKKFTLVGAILTVIVLLGLTYRLTGISSNHSFWTDEAYMASMARGIILSKTDIKSAVKVQDYQPLQLLIVTASMAIFGKTEWSARIITVVAGTVGILFAYLLATKISNKEGGLLAAFLYAFSQLNLSISTQAKQYAALQTIMLIIFYLYHTLIAQKGKSTKSILGIHATIIALCTVATLLHFIGVISWISYLIYLIFEYRKTLVNHITPKNIVLIVSGVIVLFYLLKINLMFKIFLGASLKETFFTHNHVTYFRELFWRSYGFITLPALFGILFAPTKYKAATLAIVAYSIVLIYLWMFKHYTHNIRYVVPLFGILFVYFAVFWSRIGQELFKGKVWITCLLVAFILFVGGNKFVRKPASYYSPNADFYGDVQNADYKSAFSYIKMRFPNYKNMTIYNDIIDAQLWFLEEKPDADAYFMKGVVTPHPHSINARMVYGTLQDFLLLKQQSKSGLLIVEDWESILPEDIKQYAKKNMKLEYRVENMEVAPTDKWPIEIYSWGMSQ